MLFAVMGMPNMVQQKDSNGKVDVLSYQHPKNGKKMQYVRVPENTTSNESFAKSSAWVDAAIELNSGGKGGDKITSAKRIAKKLMTSYRDA